MLFAAPKQLSGHRTSGDGLNQMPDPTQIPFLLRLLDDESETVREKIMDEFKAFGTSLEVHLASLDKPLEKDQQRVLRKLIKKNRRTIFRRSLFSWVDIQDDMVKLEAAFEHIADYINGTAYPVKLKFLLDALSDEYKSIHQHADVLSLARFLFEMKGLKGADTDYYSPHNSDLVSVLQTGKGLPISLACIYMLVGSRLGLTIEGCNIPGHFFARVQLSGETFLVDCFNSGHFFLADEVQAIEKTESLNIKQMLESIPDAEAIIRRVLMNLIRAYQYEEDQEECIFFIELLTEMNELKKSF